MPNKQLLDYIKSEIEKGESKQNIKQRLLAQGWREEDVEEGFGSIVSSSETKSKVADSNTLPTSIELLRDSFKLYKQRFGTFIGITLLSVLILVTSFVLVGLVLTGVIIAGGFNPIVFAILAAILIFILYFLNALQWIALFYAVKDSKEKLSIIDAYKKGIRNIFSYMWVMLLYFLSVFIGLILFIIPGIYFALVYAFAPFVLLSGDAKGNKALKKSKELIKGRIGAVFFRLLITGGAVILPALALILVTILIFGSESAVVSIIDALIGLLSLPVVITVTYKLYENLKALPKKEK